jgi:hypothetical protein
MGTLVFNDDFIESGIDGIKPQSWNRDVYPHFVTIRTLLNGNIDATNLGVTAGTVVASKVVTVDANKDAGSFRNITLTGELDSATGDFSGDVDIAGDLTLSGGADGALRFSVASSVKILDNSATSLVFEEADNAYMTFVTTDSSEAIKFDKSLDINASMDVDADVDITGTTTLNGVLQVKNGATSAGKIEIYEDSDDGAHKLTLTAPALAGDVTLTFPNTDGDADQVLKTNGSGVMSWSTVGGAYDDWSILTDSATVASKAQVICNKATAMTVTLPSSPSAGNTVTIKNVGAGTVTVGRNGKDIDSVAENGTLLTDSAVQLVFVNDTFGWVSL